MQGFIGSRWSVVALSVALACCSVACGRKHREANAEAKSKAARGKKDTEDSRQAERKTDEKRKVETRTQKRLKRCHKRFHEAVAKAKGIGDKAIRTEALAKLKALDAKCHILAVRSRPFKDFDAIVNQAKLQAMSPAMRKAGDRTR